MKHIWWKVHTSIQKGGDKKACQSQPKKRKREMDVETEYQEMSFKE